MRFRIRATISNLIHGFFKVAGTPGNKFHGFFSAISGQQPNRKSGDAQSDDDFFIAAHYGACFFNCSQTIRRHNGYTIYLNCN